MRTLKLLILSLTLLLFQGGCSLSSYNTDPLPPWGHQTPPSFGPPPWTSPSPPSWIMEGAIPNYFEYELDDKILIDQMEYDKLLSITNALVATAETTASKGTNLAKYVTI